MILDYTVHKKMIKMNCSPYFISLIFACIVLTINSQDVTLNATETAASTSIGPGISGCYYYGALDTQCGIPVVPISSLPVDCTSFFVDALNINLAHNVKFVGGKDFEKFLDELLMFGKPVYVRFGHYFLGEWTQVFGCDGCSEINACDEMDGVIAYLNEHQGITGLVLTGLTPCPCVKEVYFPHLSESLKTYISVVKATFPNLQIAISIPGWFLADYYEDPKVEWLDFTVLDSVVDFYEIYFSCLEICSEATRNIGPTPINGNFTYTMEKILSTIPYTKIPKKKIHFRIELNPTSSDPNVGGCQTSNEQMCSDPDFSKDWCSDTLKTYYGKGLLANKLGKGFIGANIDYDDPYGCCQCQPFPAFHAILNGFNCAEPPPPCPLIDRP